MQEKCDGWKEEVERLLPLEDELKRVQKENEELAQQMTMMVEEVERKREVPDTTATSSNSAGNMMDYDTLMHRMEELQDTRVKMEEELRSLREERASILQENAGLRESNQPQVYFNLKTKYEEALQLLQNHEQALAAEKQLKAELEAANLEMHQKLVSAINPENLKTIQERVARYKSERDQARAELDSVHKQLLVAKQDTKSAQDVLTSAQRDADTYKQLFELKEDDIAKLKRELQRIEPRMHRYREERNLEKEHAKQLRQQLTQLGMPHSAAASLTLEGSELDVAGLGVEQREASHSPSHEAVAQFASSPTISSDYPSLVSHASNELAHLQLQRDCDTPEEGTTSPTYKYHSKAATADLHSSKLPHKDLTSLYHTVTVLTKDGVVKMDVQKPSQQLNPKQKPQVIVRREAGVYESGMLMWVGKINGKDMAGVQMDVKLSSK